MFGGLMQPTHLILLLLVVLVLLGPKRLPEAGRSLGRGLREFKDSVSGEDQDAERQATVKQAEPAAVLHAEPDRDKARL